MILSTGDEATKQGKEGSGERKKDQGKDIKEPLKEKKDVAQDKKDKAKEKKTSTQEKKDVAQEKKDQAKEKKKARDPNKPKKPLSSYLIFGYGRFDLSVHYILPNRTVCSYHAFSKQFYDDLFIFPELRTGSQSKYLSMLQKGMGPNQRHGINYADWGR